VWHSGTTICIGLLIDRWQVCLPFGLCSVTFVQIVHTTVSLLPAGIKWYWCKKWKGRGSLWNRCDLPSEVLHVLIADSKPWDRVERRLCTSRNCDRALLTGLVYHCRRSETKRKNDKGK